MSEGKVEPTISKGERKSFDALDVADFTMQTLPTLSATSRARTLPLQSSLSKCISLRPKGTSGVFVLICSKCKFVLPN